MTTPAPYSEDDARELEVYLENTSRFSPMGDGIGKVTAQNLLKKMERGTYRHDLAPKAWLYVVEAAAKGYRREFAGGDPQVFSVATRKAVARDMADAFQRDVEGGEYEHLQARASNPGMPQWDRYLGVR